MIRERRSDAQTARSKRRRPSGFTLIEMLVVVVILGIVIAVLLPGIQAARECARRLSCAHHLSQLMLAVHNYELAYGVYPPGTIEKTGPIQNHAFGYHHNWIVQILPYFEQQNTAALIDRRFGVYHTRNAEARTADSETLNCPSQPVWGWGFSSYAGVYHDEEAPIDKDNDGVFFLNSRIAFDDLADGASQTLFLGEKLVEQGDLGWMSGTSATLRNTGLSFLTTRTAAGGVINWGQSGFWKQDDGWAFVDDQVPESAVEPPAPQGPVLPIGGFGSVHNGGCQFAFGDGRVALISEDIELAVLRQLGHRSDGQLLSSGSYQP